MKIFGIEINGLVIFGALMLTIGLFFCIWVFTSWEKTEGVVAKKEYSGGGRGASIVLTVSYTYDGESYRRYADPWAAGFYGVGSRVVIYDSPSGTTETYLSDVLTLPILGIVTMVIAVIAQKKDFGGY